MTAASVNWIWFPELLLVTPLLILPIVEWVGRRREDRRTVRTFRGPGW